MREYSLELELQTERVDGRLESPSGQPAGLVILAHGLSANRNSRYLRDVAHRLHRAGVATVSMDAPLHGSRRAGPEPTAFHEWVKEWQTFWRADGYQRIAAEYSKALDASISLLGPLPTAFWGVSLATQCGVPWLASERRARAAVLGLFRGDGQLMRRFAPKVGVPVFFIQQRQDELHPVRASQQLVDQLGGEVTLRSSEGGHSEVPAEVIAESAEWLAAQLTA